MAGGADRLGNYAWHSALGYDLFALIMLRLLWRWLNPVPELPADLKPWERVAAHVGHISLYVLMFIVSLTGWTVATTFPVPMTAIKHAFPHGIGHVMLSVEQVGDQIELIVADDGVGIKEKDSAKVPEKRGSDYVAIFVRQLGGTVAPSGSEGTGTIVRIRLPLLLVPPDGAERVAA